MIANETEDLKKHLDGCVGSRYFLSGGTAILEGSDLNEYFSVGNYYCELNAIDVTLKNYPIGNAFTLKIERGTGISYATQTLRDFYSGNIYFRMNEFATEWGMWRKIQTVET